MIDTQFLYREVPDTISGFLMIVVSAILIIWGVALLVSSMGSDQEGRGRPRWHPRRWYSPGFPFALGIFMLTDASIYGLLGITTLQSPEGTPVWAMIYVTCVAFSAILAFGWWAKDRLPEERS